MFASVCALLLLQSAQLMRPFLGVTAEPVATPIEAAGQSFPCALRITFVTPDSGAAAAGLAVGDLIVRIDGEPLAGPAEALGQQLIDAVGKHRRGERLQLEVVRDGQLHQFAATLGVRPTQNPVSRVMPPNDEILPEPPAESLAPLVDALLKRFAAKDDWQTMLARLDRLNQAADPLRLSRTAYVLREPLAMPAISQDLAAVPADLAQALRHAASRLDCPTDAQPPLLKTGLSPQQHAEQIESLLLSVRDEYDAALASLSADQRQRLIDLLPDVESSFREVVMVLSDTNAERRQHVIEFVRLAQQVDLSRLATAGVKLAALAEPAYLAGLQHDLQAAQIKTFTYDTPLGPIVFTGDGPTWHNKPAAVIVDLAGDDRYSFAPPRPVSVIIDYAGDDAYSATFDGAQGGGVFGLSLLVDLAGDDRYLGQQWSQAAGALGVGLLRDRAGDDVYQAADYSQAAAFCGYGILIDEAGDDHYQAPRYAQALAMPGGFAALIDLAGDDAYDIGGRDPTNYGTPGVFDAMGQACGIGFRGLASGGIAVLRDEGGDDVYRGDNFAQGGGYYFGWGCLVDEAGDDRYLGSRYAQGWAAHQAFGYLEDRGGDDYYESWRAVGQSCSWDETITALFDRDGDDTYMGGGPFGRGGFALCASHNNALALFVDFAGRDRYPTLAGAPRADGRTTAGSFSVLVDLSGGEDQYAGDEMNGSVLHARQHSFFADLPAGLEQAPETVKAGTDGKPAAGAQRSE